MKSRFGRESLLGVFSGPSDLQRVLSYGSCNESCSECCDRLSRLARDPPFPPPRSSRAERLRLLAKGRPMHRAKSEYAIQTVTNAPRVLDVFEADEEIGVTELARRLHLHKNNVFRLLATLEDKGWVEQSEESERYRLGAACLRLARNYARTHGLTRWGRAALEQLARETGETAHLGVLREFEVVHLDGEQSSGLLVSGVRTGLRMPCHSTALGKVLLGCGAPGTIEGYDRQIPARGLEALTRDTIVDRDK